jgi:hypothetical protein
MVVAEALRTATPTLRDVAGWIKVSYGTIRAYATEARHPGPEGMHRLAVVLRQQARRLDRLADRLDRQAEGRAAQ